MNKRTAPTGEIYANSTCRDLGHSWITTTAPNYRVCDRMHCHAAERWLDGAWVRVEKRRTRSASVLHHQAQQQRLFPADPSPVVRPAAAFLSPVERAS